MQISYPVSWGSHHVSAFPLEVLFDYLNLKALYKLSWGGAKQYGDDWEKIKSEFDARLLRMKKEVLSSKWLKPQGLYGYWPAKSAGNDIILFQPETLNSDHPQELSRFTFPRQPEGEKLCIADYIEPLQSETFDITILQIVTMGSQATKRFETLQESGEYSEAYFTHGLAVQLTEAAAEYLHNHIRRDLNIPLDQGKRYSWGYPAMPDISDHKKVFSLLPAEDKLKMRLTSAFQMIPEQSTAALIVLNPIARYFNVKSNKI
jgi:5-methyltetrahydrofolate--homocysteine methyltransferase